MIGFSLWLLGVAVADLLVGIEPEDGAPRRYAVAVLAAVALALGLVLSMLAGAVPALVAAALVGSVVWVWLVLAHRALASRESEEAAARAWVALAYFAALTGSTLALASWLPGYEARPLSEWLNAHPLLGGIGLTGDALLLLLAVGLLLTQTGNVLVRLLLTGARVKLQEQEDRMPGGRFIGPLERVLVVTFLLAGELLGAALVVSAKGLLRFPELARPRDGAEPAPTAAANTPDARRATEYLLIGSLASWLLAILASGVLRLGLAL